MFSRFSVLSPCCTSRLPSTRFAASSQKQNLNAEEDFGTTQTVFNGKSAAQVLTEAHQLVAKTLIPLAGEDDKSWSELLESVVPTAIDQTIAMRLSNAMHAVIFVGALANNHPQAAKIKALASLIARLTKTQRIVLPTANSTAAHIAGAIPDSQLIEHEVEHVSLDAQQSWQQCLRAYVLFGIEPELDCADPAQARQSLQQASFVVSINSYVTDTILEYSDVLIINMK